MKDFEEIYEEFSSEISEEEMQYALKHLYESSMRHTLQEELTILGLMVPLGLFMYQAFDRLSEINPFTTLIGAFVIIGLWFLLNWFFKVRREKFSPKEITRSYLEIQKHIFQFKQS